MAYTFSKRSTFDGCRKDYYRKYIEKRRGPKSDPMMIGIEGDTILEAIVAARLDGRIKTPSDVVPFMRELIDDVEDADGVITSHKQSAAWIIEQGLEKLTQVLIRLKGADQVLTQEQLYFNEHWELIEQEPGEHIGAFKNRAVWGGDLDISYIHEDVACVEDWKTGKSRWSKPQQVIEYQALMFMAYDGLSQVNGGLIWLAENKYEAIAPMFPRGVQPVLDQMDCEAYAIESATTYDCSGCFRCRED